MNTIKAIALGIFSAVTLFLPAEKSFAQESCRVADRTNTPLNVRAEPNGRVVATLNNDEVVVAINRSVDQRGRVWVYIRKAEQLAPLGWAFNDFVRCSTPEFAPVESLYRAWNSLDIALYAAQWAPNAYKIDNKRGARTESTKLFAERETLFSDIRAVDADFTPILEISSGDEALIRVSYSLKIAFKSGRTFAEKDCETYLVRRFGHRWLIVVNNDHLPCSLASAITSERNPTIWNHNGSTVMLIAKGTSRQFVYDVPRNGIADQGVEKGTTLFTGTFSNGQYRGTAHIFRRGCGAFPYQVSGQVLDGFRRVVMNGQAPRIDANCRVTGYFADRLQFTLIDQEISLTEPPRVKSADTRTDKEVEIAEPKNSKSYDNKSVEDTIEKSGQADRLFYFLLALVLLFVFAFLVHLFRTRANGAAYSSPVNASRSERHVKSTEQNSIKSSNVSQLGGEVGVEQVRSADNKKSAAKMGRAASISKRERATSINDGRVSVGVPEEIYTTEENNTKTRNRSKESIGLGLKGAGVAMDNRVILLVIGVLILCSGVLAYMYTSRDDCTWLENLDKKRLQDRLALAPLTKRMEIGQQMLMLGFDVAVGEGNRSFEETKKKTCTHLRTMIEPIYNW